MVRIRAAFIDSMDGWVDDSNALNRPWGFNPRSITVPVGISRGTKDRNVSSDHAEWLLATIPAAQDHEYLGGHVPSPAAVTALLATGRRTVCRKSSKGSASESADPPAATRTEPPSNTRHPATTHEMRKIAAVHYAR